MASSMRRKATWSFEPGLWSGFGFEHLGEPVAHDAGVGPGEGEGGSEPEVSQPVAVAALHALDEPMQTESPEVVGHPARGDVAGIDPQQWSDILSQIAIGKPAVLATADPLVEDDGALLVEDAEVEGSGMEVDAAVVQVLLSIESHGPLLGVMWNRNQHPLKTTTIVSNVFAANRWRKAT